MPSKLKSLVPSFLTMLSLSAGTLAILLLDLYWSPRLIIVAAVFDLLDGAAARALNATSEMGKELDSISDMVSFGLAPAAIYWLLVPNTHYWLIIFPIFLVCSTAWRLAKFNTLPSKPYFIGMPSPASALLIVGLAMGIHWGSPLLLTILGNEYAYILIAVFLVWSMNRNRIMMSFKGWSESSEKPWLLSLGLGAIILFILDYQTALPAVIILYSLLSDLKEITSPTSS